MRSSLFTALPIVVISFLLHARAQTVTSFDGISASQVPVPQLDFDPNGAIGTKQYMEWVNVYYQAYDKTTFTPVWSAPQKGTAPFANTLPNCTKVGGDGLILFDRMASRWVISVKSNTPGPNYYECVAISNTDDLTSSTLTWYTYQFNLTSLVGVNSKGVPYFPDWPKMGVWSNGYYVSFDLLDVNKSFLPIGVLVCALDRTNMINGGTPNKMQCFSDPDPIPTSGPTYLRHSLIPADVEGTTPPPSGRDEFLISIQNPPIDKKTNTSSSLNLWDIHIDWNNPTNSALSQTPLSVPVYTPGCYNVNSTANTVCVPEPSLNSNGQHYRVDSIGDRLMPRMSYRNFGTYESFLISHTVQPGTIKQTGIRWYELRGSGTPTLFQSGTVSLGTSLFRFLPSIAQDKVGDAAVGYSVSSISVHPGIRASWWNLPKETASKEITLFKGTADEQNATTWGDYDSMTVDPVDGCTFWFVDEYFSTNQTTQLNWHTRISKFKISSCK
jgi:hypothetical protein